MKSNTQQKFMAKVGASLGGLIGLIISLILITLPSGTETLDKMPEMDINQDLDKTIDDLGDWFITTMILIVFGGVNPKISFPESVYA